MRWGGRREAIRRAVLTSLALPAHAPTAVLSDALLCGKQRRKGTGLSHRRNLPGHPSRSPAFHVFTQGLLAPLLLSEAICIGVRKQNQLARKYWEDASPPDSSTKQPQLENCPLWRWPSPREPPQLRRPPLGPRPPRRVTSAPMALEDLLDDEAADGSGEEEPAADEPAGEAGAVEEAEEVAEAGDEAKDADEAVDADEAEEAEEAEEGEDAEGSPEGSPEPSDAEDLLEDSSGACSLQRLIWLC